MREILLRSWNDAEKKFYYFLSGRYYSDAECKHCVSERICTEFYWGNVEQFTGLTDKNGKKIFDGDKWSRDGYVGVIEFRHSQWQIATLPESKSIQYPSFYSNAKTGETIGNIHDKEGK